MSGVRLSGLDASFLAVETPTAHIHVGWVATFSPPAGESLPSFEEVRDHIARRLVRAPRWRQRLAPVPLGWTAPEWADDTALTIDRHLYRAPGPLRGLVDEVMSIPLRRDRPLWEMWVCEEPDEQRLAVIGKAHHCMVDGIAAVQLGSLLLDLTPTPADYEPDEWQPAPAPGGEGLLIRGVRDLVAGQLGLLRAPLAVAVSPVNTARQTLAGAVRATRALSHSLFSDAPASALNRSLSPLRSLAWAERPLEDLRQIKQVYGTTINDVMLAAVAGGMRAFLADRGERPIALKAMVPVNVRSPREELGNRISFVFAELPCDEPHPLGRLYRVHATMSARKRNREPEGADLALKAAARTPVPVQHAISKMMASPRTFNLVVSNIPGPPLPMYMRGCPLQAIYPVVPLADRHTVSVGMTTVGERACFGVYADREALPDADALARHIDEAVGELLAGSLG
ncbi:MAG TPA: wax ester/triacylglycerol synthase family O-acyltransferase [Solirubrobacteraceae bacterium]|jgi:diacylglycerol O-acyltransferase|nr:wax ester/triacylglycerol synthase family O-acyltransferase [Solirubrobacteraceae bacterium]